MSPSIRLLVALLAGAVFAQSLLSAPPEEQASNVVLVTLRPDITVSRTRVCIEDIAVLEGGNSAERAHMGRLDLIELPTVGTPVLVSREHVMYRLLLAGVDHSRFEVTGPAVVHVGRMPEAATAGQLVHVGHREPAQVQKASETTPSGPILIKRRDNVEIVLRIGDLQVTARGEALQDGRAGERISVRNVDSNRVIHGKVVDQSAVEIDFNGSKP